MRRLQLLFMLLIGFNACRQAAPPPEQAPITETKQHLPPDDRYGQLFVDVQLARVFPDGKTFVDCTPKYPTDAILEKYAAQKNQQEFNLKAFILENFDMPKQYASGFQTDKSRDAAAHINSLWEVLTRQPDAKSTGTLIPLPHSYIVPGGRFGEIYYWDSYFTMLGLQTAGKTDMIENMVDNFAYIIDTLGFIPNGNRTYFNSRSQPPFFGAMVQLLAEEKGDGVYYKYAVQLDKEYRFWMNKSRELYQSGEAKLRTVRLEDGSKLNRYWDNKQSPRAEMYADDIETAKESNRDYNEVYRNLRAACESGWDFSSRWFEDPNELNTIIASEIIPVDLNCLLYNLELVLEQAYAKMGESVKMLRIKEAAEARKAAIQKYHWSEEQQFFVDYHFPDATQRTNITAAGLYPLYFKVATQAQADQVAATLKTTLLAPGGILTTLNKTGQQWDAPNGWAPLQWIAIQGLRNYGHDTLAEDIKNRWVALNVKVYESTGKMVEKYNVVDMGLEGGGGEYPVQDGFGWTNGVLLRLLSEGEKE
ncbi:MAG: alpha,alpha-trehalase TreF [Bacteroidota bacterium]